MNIGAYAFLYVITYPKITVMSPILPLFLHMWILRKFSKSSPVTGLEWPRGLQEFQVPRFHDVTGWW